MSVNARLEEQVTNQNGITYVSAKTLQEGDVFEGYLVGNHMDRDDKTKISTLVFQDENKELFGLNANFVFIGGFNKEDAGLYDKVKVTYGGKKKLDGYKNAAHQWEVIKSGKKITEADSVFGTGGQPQTIRGL